jgi:methyl-accepting chemotaxis protein
MKPATLLPSILRRSIRAKLMAVFALIFVVMGIAFGIVIVFTNDVHTDVSTVDADYLPMTRDVGSLHRTLAEYRSHQLSYLLATNAQDESNARDALAKAQAETVAAFNDLAALPMTPAEQADYAQAKADWERYLAETQDVATDTSQASKAQAAAALASGDPSTTMKDMDTDLDAWTSEVGTNTDGVSGNAVSSLETMPFVIVGSLVVVIALGVLFAFLFSRGVANGLRAVQTTLTSMADNCATSLANGLGALAENDLTHGVRAVTEPIGSYGSDEIGQTAAVTNRVLSHIHTTIDSYERARAGLAETIGEVKSAAESVARTGADLNAAATQSGVASAQIAQTINQVAAGASEQARASSETSNASVELGAVIGQVGAGAGDTSRKVEAASQALSDMASAIERAALASTEVTSVSVAAISAAERGRAAVRQTVAEMSRIKATVETASVRVTELGAKSDQIGAIVETIDDIAEQTNLLALNAAIEAARAGEQGKGFAVVADEVRKLAERSSRATKEIAALIADVQAGTTQAVEAMQAGADEVEQGSELAGQAGQSLDEIADASHATKSAVGQITAAVDAMKTASEGVVSASDAISSIAEETNAAALRMTESAETVSRAVQSIAAISEENSASAEEVSAATEEMSGQAEELSATATSLAEMAGTLDRLVGKFRIEGSASRAADFSASSARTSGPSQLRGSALRAA